MTVFTLSYRVNKSTFISREQQIIQDFQALLALDKNTLKSSSYYADQLNISKVYLEEVVKKTTRKTLSRTIKLKRVLKAKTYLLQTPLTISEIAYKLGFDDASNFTRFFKKETGFTPSKFRAQN